MGLFNLFRPPIPEEHFDCDAKRCHSSLFSKLSERWPQSYFDTDAFYLRLNRALYDVPQYSLKSIDKHSMEIYSESQERLYYCDLTRCDCEDFRKKQLPCKHMIFLDISINGLDNFYSSAFGFSAVDVSAAVAARQSIWGVIQHFSNDCTCNIFSLPRTPSLDRLISSGYLVEHFQDNDLLKKFNRSELAALIRISGASPSGSKDKLIQFILSNSPPIIQYCRLKYAFLSFPESSIPLFHFLHRYTYTNNCLPRSE